MAARISPAIALADRMHTGAHRASGKRSPGSGIEDLITFGDPMTGTANDDFIFGTPFHPALNKTIVANAGDDFAIGDIHNSTMWAQDSATTRPPRLSAWRAASGGRWTRTR